MSYCLIVGPSFMVDRGLAVVSVHWRCLKWVRVSVSDSSFHGLPSPEMSFEMSPRISLLTSHFHGLPTLEMSFEMSRHSWFAYIGNVV